MKRYIRSSNIFGMSFGRAKCLQRMEYLSPKFNKHLIECVVYRNVLDKTLDHWISEIANFLHAANQFKCDSKLKYKDYEQSLFSDMGTERDDCYTSIFIYQQYVEDTNKYPYFDITDDMVDELFDITNKIKEISIPILLSGDKLTQSEWKEKLTEVFNK